MFCPFFLRYVKLLRGFFFFWLGWKRISWVGGNKVRPEGEGLRFIYLKPWGTPWGFPGCDSQLSDLLSPRNEILKEGARSNSCLWKQSGCAVRGSTTNVCWMNNWMQGRNLCRWRSSRVEDGCGCCVWEPNTVTFSFSIAGFLQMKTEDDNSPPPP